MPRGGRGGGRGFKRGGQRGGQGGRGGGDNRDRREQWGSRKEITRTNELLESFYNELEILEEDEKEAFWKTMREELPNSFRFAGSRGHALTVQKRLIDHYIPEITAVEWEGQPVPPPTAVPWYPDQLAWSMATPKNVIRKFPPFASFQKFLVSENGVGNITRQEVVSMIPPLLMDVKPGMTVLDLCAAPGSKSAQIIEMVHGGEEARVRKVREKVAREQGLELRPDNEQVALGMDKTADEDDWSDDGRSTGLLVANDVDYKRAQMLIHQCKRLNSPNLLVVNHDATLFPSIKIAPNRYLKFDRILADVPCSGDGTLRKNPEIWRDWAPSKALGLHVTQVRILVRALQMLKVGGRVVYSTCSMNPVENEAVVASAIARCGGLEKVQIVDKSEALPGLKRKPGLTKWKVMDKGGTWWNSFKEMTRTREERGLEASSKVIEGMFPPAEEIPLHRCVRIYPHLQDTGGFFITVLEKLGEIRARPENFATVSAADPPPNSVMALVNEIASKGEQAKGGSVLDTLENQLGVSNTSPAQDPLPAARQNQANETKEESRKRPLEDEATGEEADALAGTKRLKTRNEETFEPTPDDVPDRRVHYPPPPARSVVNGEEHVESLDNAPRPRNGTHGASEEAFIYISPDHEEVKVIEEFYSIHERFPRDRYMVRNPTGDPAKSIYYSSALVRDILVANQGSGIKFVHGGVKMFVKQDTQAAPEACKWRIQSDGMPILEGWVGESRVVELRKKSTLHSLLLEMFPKLSDGGYQKLGEVGAQAMKKGVGCLVLRSTGTEPGDEAISEKLVMPLWRGANSLNLMLPKEDRRAMLLRLFGQIRDPIDNSRGGRLAGKGNDPENDAKPPTDAELEAMSSEEEGGVALEANGDVGMTGTDDRAAAQASLAAAGTGPASVGAAGSATHGGDVLVRAARDEGDALAQANIQDTINDPVVSNPLGLDRDATGPDDVRDPGDN